MISPHVVFRLIDGRELHVAREGDRFVIACKEKHTYVILERRGLRWNVELCERGGSYSVYLGEYPTREAAKMATERIVEWQGLVEESLPGPWCSKKPKKSQLRALLDWNLELESRIGFRTRGRVADDIALGITMGYR